MSAVPVGYPFAYLQCRTPDHVILVKAKNDGVVVKIFDVAQKRLHKCSLSAREIGIERPLRDLAQKNINDALRKWAQVKLLPQAPGLTPAEPREVISACLQQLQEMIRTLKPQIEHPHLVEQGLVCPITNVVFEHPVVDEHGHTFEESAIRAWMAQGKKCPINPGQRVGHLAPNRAVREQIEAARKKDPIPTLALFKEVNERLARLQVQLAQANDQEGKFEDALKAYADALPHTKDLRVYASIPMLFERMEQIPKAILALLYLAQYQLQEGMIRETAETLRRLQRLNPENPSIPLLLSKLYLQMGEPAAAVQVALEGGRTFARSHPEQSAALYKHVLFFDPHHVEACRALRDLLEQPQEKAHLSLLGACHALERDDVSLAKKFSSGVSQHNTFSFLDCLVHISCMTDVERKEKLGWLAMQYQMQQQFQSKLKVLKLLLQMAPGQREYRNIAAAYRDLKRPEKTFLWNKRWVFFLMQKGSVDMAEKTGNKLLQKLRAPEQVLEMCEVLEEIYIQQIRENASLPSPKLSELYQLMGRVQRESGQIVQAEATYRRALERFRTGEHALFLAEILRAQGKTPESVRVFYEATVLFLSEQNVEGLETCVASIETLDPRKEMLDLPSRMQILTQRELVRLHRELRALREQVRAAPLPSADGKSSGRRT